MTKCLPLLTATVLTLGAPAFGVGNEASGEARSAVVLIPGLGNGGTVWELQGYLEQFAAHPRFFAAGHVRADETTAPEMPAAVLAAYQREEIPVFTFGFPDGGRGDIRESGRRLAEGLTRLRLAYDVTSFTLVGKSLGGVIAREYLTSALYANDVERLVTVSSPHLGSELAFLPEVYHWLKDRSNEGLSAAQESNGGWFRRSLDFCRAKVAVAGLETAACLRGTAARAHWNIDAVAVRMLIPPESGNYLQQLNGRPHPEDVDYVCVVTEMSVSNYACEDFLADWKQWRSGKAAGPCRTIPALTDLVRAGMHLCLERMNASPSALAGDGVVSVVSQNLNAVEAFAGDPDLSAHVIRLSAGHHDVHHQFHLAQLLSRSLHLAVVP